VEAISAANLKKAFGSEVILDGASLELSRGDRAAVYGPTGAGKTTLLLIIAGLVRPDEGEVSLFCKEVTGDGVFAPPEERGLGVVFQKALLWPHMKVLANVEYALLSAGLSRGRRRERAREALELFGVAELSDRRPRTLSGGQAQRVALARSIAARPGILLWDEPFSGLDDETRDSVAARALEYLRRSETTLLLISHRRSDFEALRARPWRLSNGRLQAEGDAR